MAPFIILARHVLTDRRGMAFGYSSLVLLIAIAAVAMIAQLADANN